MYNKPNQTKPKLLYIDHSWHIKHTNSTNFFIDILRSHFELDFLTLDSFEDYLPGLENAPAQFYERNYDVLLLFQVLIIPPSTLRRYFKFKKGVVVPMYDDAVSYLYSKVWVELKDFNIINFSKTLHEKLLDMGLSSFYIQYFPKPLPISDLGDTNAVYLWQRDTRLNINTFERIFRHLKIKKAHIHNSHKDIDPHNVLVKPLSNDYEITYSTWYEKRADMQSDMQHFAIYVAPRLFEGIGMSFLEAMAMGRCVVSPDNPTMNEYIVDGKTGILYDFENPKLRQDYDIKALQQNTINYIKQGYAKWEKEKFSIIDFINAPVQINEDKLKAFAKIATKANKAAKKKQMRHKIKCFIECILSIKNSQDKRHKVISIFGLKIKIKRRLQNK